MTFEEKILELLEGNGMFRDQAEAVLKRTKESDANVAMREVYGAGEVVRDKWREDISGYPPQMLAVLWMSARTHAVEYIDEVCPLAWFRPLFAGEGVKTESAA